jgi:RNA polymerase sigma-70 factor (ECF subfamily)
MGTATDHDLRAGSDTEVLPTRRSLLSRLRDWEDSTSWQDFFDTYWRLIYGVARKAGLSDAEAQDVVQETVLSVARKMKEFRYDPARGSFKGWLLQLTGWRIRNQLRKRGRPLAPEPEADSGDPSLAVVATDVLAVAPELERTWEAEWEEHLLRAAMQRVRGQVNPKHLQIFDLYVVQQQSVAEVRRFLGVSAAEVYLAKHRVGKLIHKERTRLRSGPVPGREALRARVQRHPARRTALASHGRPGGHPARRPPRTGGLFLLRDGVGGRRGRSQAAGGRSDATPGPLPIPHAGARAEPEGPADL